MATPGSKSFDDPGILVEIPLVNEIRPCVKAWREAGYPRCYQHHQTPIGMLARPRGVRYTGAFFFC
ncbi:hypothetical protein MPNT_510009 [Candidatus Methylacidithermus pantelleriae]|uniref:Uncharacterized protein n=1 Tax=Candidatus Methylacidithermus pantelleriae TaxID=2744239 RepID=A0A8J2FTQ5_9BACT|nr:hypothetical protein MPNT_510009 [Candidatus Methylacidithermus pantelleriae]